MASSYSTDLKLELMATGENSGTWGDKTNSNLNLLQQAIAGYQLITLTSTNTTLVMTDATISNARNAVIEFAGTITANTTVFVASGIEKTYILKNGTTGAFTLALNQVGGASVIFGSTDKTTKQVYLNGTDAVDLATVNLTAPQTLTNKTLTSPTITSPTITSPIIDKINDSNGNEEIIFTTTTSAVNEFTITNAATGNGPEISTTGGDTNIDLKITPKGSGKIILDGLAFPNADGTANQFIKTNGSGVLSFATISSAVPTIQRFTSGSGTYTTPAGVTYIIVEMAGGGGGGGGGGIDPVSGNAGGNGGNTTFGTSLHTAGGGSGASANIGNGGSAGGTFTLGAGGTAIFTSNGSRGAAGIVNISGNTFASAGYGGANPFAGTGPGGAWVFGGGAGLVNTGAGGGGGTYGSDNSVTSGGAGGGAGGYMKFLISSPSATYAYAVGAAGTAGAAGTGTNVTGGGAGGSGIIIITEYYN